MAGHQGFVVATCFSGDGARLYSASIEGQIGVWDPDQGSSVAAWNCHRGPVNALVWDGELISGGLDGTVAVWNATDGSLLRRLEGHSGGVMGVAVRGNRIASASADGRIGIWRRDSGEPIGFLKGHEEAVTSVAFLDNDTLVSGSRDCSVRLWDIGARASLNEFQGHGWWVTKVGIALGDQLVSVSEDCTLRVWDARSGKVRWVFGECPGPIWGLGMHPDGIHAVIGYGGVALKVNLDDHSSVEVPTGAPGSSRGISVSPRGDLLALGQDHGEIQVVDLTGSQIVSVCRGTGARILSGIASPGMAVQATIEGGVSVRTPTLEAALPRAHDFFVYATRRLTDSRFATGAFDRRVRVWEAGVTEPIAEFDHGGLIFSLVACSGGQRVLSGGGDRIGLWEVDTGECAWQMADAGVGGHLVATIDERTGVVAAVGEAGFLKTWRLDDGATRRWPLPDAHNCAIEVLPGGESVVVGSAYGRLSLVGIHDGVSIPLHGEHEDWIRIVRVSADGQRIASVSQNGTGRIFDRGENAVVYRFDDRPVALVDFDGSGALYWMDCLGNLHQQ